MTRFITLVVCLIVTRYTIWLSGTCDSFFRYGCLRTRDSLSFPGGLWLYDSFTFVGCLRYSDSFRLCGCLICDD